MKRNIEINDLRIGLEERYYKRIKPVIDSLKKKYPFLNEQENKRNVEFYSLIGHSISINNHYAVKYLLERVKKNLLIDVNISMYLHQSTIFNITCLPRKKDDLTEVLIFVSQHFFNNLCEDEQLAIIGHEIAHFILGHLELPVHEILNYPFDIEEINGLKANILSWSKACEITADMIGLVANDFNFKAYSTAIIKYSTGLNDSFNSSFNILPLVELTLDQYESMASDPLYSGDSSTHPLTPLRVKILNVVTKKSLLFKNFGDRFDEEKIQQGIKDYNKVINELVKSIYPEMFPGLFDGVEVVHAMAYAVALSDGIIDLREEKAIKRMLPKSKIADEYFQKVKERFKNQSYEVIVKELINESIIIGKEKEFSKNTVVSLVRVLLLIAASDDEIVKSELETIFSFAKPFNVSRQEIITVLKTHNYIHY